MGEKSPVFEKPRDERLERGKQLYRLGKITKRSMPGGTEFEVRDGGSRHRVFKRDGKTCCSCFEFILYRKHQYWCEHFYAVREFLEKQKEREGAERVALTAEVSGNALRFVRGRLAAVRDPNVFGAAGAVEAILNELAPGWSKAVASRQRVSKRTLLVVRLTVCGISRDGIGFSEREALANAAQKFGLFRAGADADDPTEELSRVTRAARLPVEENRSTAVKTRESAGSHLRLVSSPPAATATTNEKDGSVRGNAAARSRSPASPSQIVKLLTLAKQINDAGGEPVNLSEDAANRYSATLGVPSAGIPCSLSRAAADLLIDDYEARLRKKRS